jgi:hypothetical protein
MLQDASAQTASAQIEPLPPVVAPQPERIGGGMANRCPQQSGTRPCATPASLPSREPCSPSSSNSCSISECLLPCLTWATFCWGWERFPLVWLWIAGGQTGCYAGITSAWQSQRALVALAYDEISLFLGLTVLGLVLSIYHPAGIALISVGIRRREWGHGRQRCRRKHWRGLWATPGRSLGRWRLLARRFLDTGSYQFPRRLFHAPSALATGGFATASPLRSSPDPNSQTAVWLILAPLYLAMMLGGLNYRTLVTALPLYLTGDASAAQALAKGGLYSFPGSACRHARTILERHPCSAPRCDRRSIPPLSS